MAMITTVACPMLVVPTDVAGADQEGDYNFDVRDGKPTVTRYIGSDSSVTIPSTLGDTQWSASGIIPSGMLR